MSKLDQMLSSKIVAVIRKVEPEKVKPLVQALVKGGVTGIEVTMDSDDSLRLIEELKAEHGDQAVIGAGTVMNKNEAKNAIAAGADFIFAPILDQETIQFTKEQGVIMIPGVFTPTEIHQADLWGADMVKVFPASVVGPQFIKDARGPLGHISMMPTGGVNLGNIESFMKAGAVAVGVGGSLVNKSLIGQENWRELEKLAKEYVESVQL
ncbi:bifunctional 4-hydroxy-2-oxoglutarate aldolase/2-dehydro-3-deoxy-phosphogluconate aldolase [Halobacillus naozhouensis]|uniref:Bifunctional 4-hydroxy-2-oxoglutarate aldolase/2-dehydro-3-deoxy-phosphogluconate aldolase n=1 Tax=Halobacillus naozhouensis TaxID=554880 RepID=A0ABY8IY62_9BACI|nr:bifunctional 4-hydroxy-2-oxoglutarate aldolase/2-dehydro-3-deoxy-phosphogluconate aldolase [Halobacillus naozhouensis]WFT74124.1 bifunctional 4-hydroxy-2-oxoglutarate aldolase/2-dehydro-3-deoxy-phosphogluconate aldolase [Halobacillus naozhouensis]